MTHERVLEMEHGERPITRRDAIAYLTQCADRQGKHWYQGLEWSADECPTCDGTNDASNAGVPCSRYGRTARDCAPVAWRVAYLGARESGEPITLDTLDHAMSLVVNNHDDVAYLIRQYGHRKYT